MGVEQDEPYAARRADMERQFQSLPAPGTPDYWRRIEQATPENALPLEVLARCVLACEQAGARKQAETIFEVIVRCIQSSIQKHVAATARASASRQKSEVAEEMEQECYMLLWEELIDPEPTFFREHFMHALKRLISHVEHACMEREGLWKRRDVTTPTRIPISHQYGFNEPVTPGETLTVGESVTDPAAQSAYEHVEFEAGIEALKASLKPDDYDLLQDLVFGDLTQKEIAERLHKTDRTVRNRIEHLREQLRRDYFGGEEGERGE